MAGTAYPSLRTLAQRTGLSRRTVIRAVQELEPEPVNDFETPAIAIY